MHITNITAIVISLQDADYIEIKHKCIHYADINML